LHILIVWNLENENDFEIIRYPPRNMRNFKRVFLETTFFKSGVYFAHKLLGRLTVLHTYNVHIRYRLTLQLFDLFKITIFPAHEE